MDKATIQKLFKTMSAWHASDRRICMPGSNRSQFLVREVKPLLKRLQRLAK